MEVRRSWYVQVLKAWFAADRREAPYTEVEYRSGRQLYIVKASGQNINVDVARKKGKL